MSLSFANDTISSLRNKKRSAKKALSRATSRVEELESNLQEATSRLMEAERTAQDLNRSLHQTSVRAQYLEEELSLQVARPNSAGDMSHSDLDEISFREEMDLSVRVNTLGDEDRAPDEESLFSPRFTVGHPLYGSISVSEGERWLPGFREKLRIETKVCEVEIKPREKGWSWMVVSLVTWMFVYWVRVIFGRESRNTKRF